MPYIPPGELPSFIIGFVFVLILWLILYGITRIFPVFKTAITKTANTRELALFMLNLVIVATGISVAVDALVIAAGGNNMTTEQLTSLAASAQGLIHMVYTLVGAALGAIVIWIIHLVMSIMTERKSSHQKSKDITTISGSSTKDVATTQPTPTTLNLTGDIAQMNSEQLKG